MVAEQVSDPGVRNLFQESEVPTRSSGRRWSPSCRARGVGASARSCGPCSVSSRRRQSRSFDSRVVGGERVCLFLPVGTVQLRRCCRADLDWRERGPTCVNTVSTLSSCSGKAVFEPEASVSNVRQWISLRGTQGAVAAIQKMPSRSWSERERPICVNTVSTWLLCSGKAVFEPEASVSSIR